MAQFQALPLPTTLQFADLADLADSLGAAFCSSPAYWYVLKDTVSASERQSALAWLLQRNVWLHLAEDCCFALRKRDLPTALLPRCPELADDKVVCYFMLINRGQRKPLRLWELVTNGLLLLPFYYGWAAARRLLYILDQGDSKKAEVWPDTEATATEATATEAKPLTTYYLHNMIVHPSMQGCKVGSTCLEQALHGIRDRHSPAHPARVTLTTQEARNVTFYQRLGFRVVAETDCPDKDQPSKMAYHDWYMQLDYHQG